MQVWSEGCVLSTVYRIQQSVFISLLILKYPRGVPLVAHFSQAASDFWMRHFGRHTFVGSIGACDVAQLVS